MRYEWIVQAGQQGLTLLEFLQDKLQEKNFSMRKIKGWIDAGFCHIAGKVERFSRTKVSPRQKISLHLPEAPASRAPIQILFEDEVLVIIDKPAGYSCDERLVQDMTKLGKKVVLVHRLDKETSGVLILAKNQKIKDYFVEEFRARRISKRYLAIVQGVVNEESGSIEDYLGPIERYQGHVKWGKVSQNGHIAQTDWKVVKRLKKATLLVLIPHTGRTHQLRIHTSNMGHPILGDKVYGAASSSSRLLLHAEAICFQHPKSGMMVEFQACFPADFKECIEALT